MKTLPLGNLCALALCSVSGTLAKGKAGMRSTKPQQGKVRQAFQNELTPQTPHLQNEGVGLVPFMSFQVLLKD